MARLSNYFPRKVIESHLLVPGGAFWMDHSFGTGDETKQRIFIVLNANPLEDEDLVLVSPSTQIEKRVAIRKRMNMQNVLVHLGISDYQPLKWASVIDCGTRPTILPKEDILCRIAKRKIQLLDPIPEHILRKIHLAIGQSKTLTSEQKRLVFGPENDDV